MLEIKGLTRYFGGLAAVNGLDISIGAGELAGLIGPNGAGKTTFFNLITGFIKPTKGQVIFEGSDITSKRPHVIAGRGIVRTFQATNIFNDLTTLQNIILASHLKPGTGICEAIFHLPGCRRKDQEILARSQNVLKMVGLSAVANERARNLTHGHKRVLGIAIALAAEPRLLLLDEPLAGMNAEEVSETVTLIRRLWESGITILLIEHNMRAAMGLCHKIFVLSFGRKIAEGTPEEIKGNEAVVQAYLGAGKNAA